MPLPPLYYPPGVPRTDPLVRLYDLVYGIQSKVNATPPASVAVTKTPAPVPAVQTSTSSAGGGGGITPVVSPSDSYGPHKVRLAVQLSTVADGSLWFETDRTVYYQYESTVGAWVWTTGTMFALIASRPADLGINDVGFLFQDTTPGSLYRWSGSGWVALSSGATIQTMDIALAAGANTISVPSGTSPPLLVVYLTQPGGGGSTITWGAGFSGVSSYIDPTASTLSVFMFAYRTSTSKWMMVGQPTTGMTP
jgi:hypothetical protein